jgi:hypothetical protein
MNHALGTVLLCSATLIGTVPLTLGCRRIADAVVRKIALAEQDLPLLRRASRDWTEEDERAAEALMQAHP